MTKEEQLKRLTETGVVAVIRTQDGDELVSICEALVEGGVVGVEITMTSPGATEAIYKASKVLKGKAIIGAGSVLDPETARVVMLAGADFIVSPILNKDVIALCRRYGKIVIPGAFTPTEILAAWETGADVVKIFPATKLGPEFIKDVKGPLPQVKLTPTGGISLKNLGEFLRAGAEFVGVGSALVSKRIVAEKDWAGLTRLAAEYIEAAQEARRN
ncbi:MAG: bifunctional 4-hydroxy-2-oxoglutarate aldolase/2-dehydro-3-deoxy-phosphogluconate aldolase [Limnochordia bacterium]|nr:bifunctional 4-hydroxy-2-oxoglutarate aldolase/2-dehydro-3-deoxy-phosphogluconate aldolase [Bacillota bacterium]HBG09876.1 2-dehydro-3-deoxyphosphogluconate aldolase [Bacillota bacterium]